MYALASQMDNLPIISLQTGEAVAWTRPPIFDIATLEVLAFRCEVAHHKRALVLMSRDIRQLATDCVIIDTEEDLTEPSDIIRLKDVLAAGYTPMDKSVVSQGGRKLGTVEDYSLNLDTYRLQKLHVRQPLLRSWLGSGLIIDRAQILDVTPRRIVVREATAEIPNVQPEPVP